MKKAAKTPENTEFAAVDAALKRAAKAAHSLARKTKTPCYIWKDGKIVNVAERQADLKTGRND
jgi:hypothetical protein